MVSGCRRGRGKLLDSGDDAFGGDIVAFEEAGLGTVLVGENVRDADPAETFRGFQVGFGQNFGDGASQSANNSVFFDGDNDWYWGGEFKKRVTVEGLDGRDVEHGGLDAGSGQGGG